MNATHTVLGAGPAGAALAAELAARELPVVLVNRSGAGPDLPGVRRAAADLTDPAQARAATAGAAVVYHAVNVPYEHQVAVMPRLGETILDAAAAAGARLVVLDTLYPYGPADGDHITEATPWAATTRKGRMRAELDRRYLAAHAAGRLPVSAGRAADFYGPGVLNSTLGGAVFPELLAGRPVTALGDVDLPHSYTFIGDVARGLATLGTDERGDGRVWHLPTAPARSTREVLELAAATAGVALELEVVTEAVPFGPFDAAFMAEYTEMLYQHTTPQHLVSTAFETAFGVEPTPLAAGLAATVDFYRELLVTG